VTAFRFAALMDRTPDADVVARLEAVRQVVLAQYGFEGLKA
jgi:hypothetical protein